MYLRFRYTDGTYNQIISSTKGADLHYDSMTSAEGKTIEKITTTYGNGGCGVYISEMKLEEGTSATIYSPAPEDMWMTDNIEYDVSGYKNNGICNGTFSWSDDTPRYMGSIQLKGTEVIQASPLSTETQTISVWFKTSKNKNTSQFICQDSASGLCVTLYQGCIISFLGGSPGEGSKCVLGDSYVENDWNHVVVIKTGAKTRDVYCNGVKLTPTTNDYWSPSTGFFVGARASNKNNAFYGQISDLRAYTTQLSEDDILELYHTPISLSSDGSLLTQGEIVES